MRLAVRGKYNHVRGCWKLKYVSENNVSAVMRPLLCPCLKHLHGFDLLRFVTLANYLQHTLPGCFSTVKESASPSFLYTFVAGLAQKSNS